MGLIITVAAIMFLILIHELGHWIFARIFGFETPTFSIGFLPNKPRLVLGKFWDTEFQITPWLYGGFVDIPGIVKREEMVKHPAWQRAIVLVGGVAMNFLFAVVVFFFLFTGKGMPAGQTYDGTLVKRVAHSVVLQPAQSIQSGDALKSVNGQPIKSAKEAIKLIRQEKGKSVNLTFSREKASFEVVAKVNEKGKVGLALADHYVTRYQKLDPVMGGLLSWTFATDQTVEMTKAFANIICKPFEAKTATRTPGNKQASNSTEGVNSLHGILAVLQFGTKMSEVDMYNFWVFIALVSLNLAIANMIPLPVLDGGHLLLLGIEVVFRKPLAPTIVGALNCGAMVLLLALFAFTLYNDIANPLVL